VYSVSFSPDGRQIVSGSRDGTLKLWDAATGREIRTFFSGSHFVNSVVFNPEGRSIASGSQDGRTCLWDISTGREIAQFIGFNDDEWLVITPEGYYNASVNGDHFLNVHVGNEVFGIDQYRAIFYNPEVVRAQLAASQNIVLNQQDFARPMNNIQNTVNFRPSSIIVESPAAGSTITTNTANLSIVVLDDNLPVTSVRVLVNGHLYHRSEPNFQYIRWDGIFQPNQVGVNQIDVITSNGLSESRQRTTVTWQPTNPPPPRKPDLYLLAIGVNHYDNISSLPFSANDARGIASTFRAQEGLMFNRVHTLVLADGESILPTAANIRNNLQFLNQGTADDYFILFLAGHGGDDGRGGWYFTARDYNSRVPASRINSEEVISILDLPGRRIAFLDTCHAGGVVGGAMDNDRLARILRESNAVIFTGSRGVQYGFQMGRLQSGAFAYSIRRSLNEGPSGTVMFLEFASNVMRETLNLTRNLVHEGVTYDGQHPNLSALNLEDFPIAIRRTASASPPSGPAPQVFTPPPLGFTNPPPSWTPPPSQPAPVLQQVVTEAAVGVLRWGIRQLFR
jgi:hypothetical protein